MAGTVGAHDVYITGLMPGYTVLQDAGMEFDPNMPFSGCLICGTVFQSEQCRVENPTPAIVNQARLVRKQWTLDHARTHTLEEHAALAKSGRTFTPEAAQKLATYGVIAIGGMVLDKEIEDAMRNAPRAPSDDADSNSARGDRYL
jgi:hypothetical protein